jgi:hypothetical protein
MEQQTLPNHTVDALESIDFGRLTRLGLLSENLIDNGAESHHALRRMMAGRF